MPAPLHPREHDRVAAVKSLRIMDSKPVPDLERIAELSAVLCGVPFGSVNIIDFDRHYTAASFGAPRIHASRADSLCALAVADDKVVYAPDAKVDARFQGLKFLDLADPPIHLFAAAPICTSDRLPVGTVRIYGSEPRELSERQLHGLEDLADLAGLSHDITLRTNVPYEAAAGLCNPQNADPSNVVASVSIPYTLVLLSGLAAQGYTTASSCCLMFNATFPTSDDCIPRRAVSYGFSAAAP